MSVTEAREILGKDADGMSDTEIINVIETLDLLANDALKLSKEEILRKRDAKALAELAYDIYQEKKTKSKPDKKKA